MEDVRGSGRELREEPNQLKVGKRSLENRLDDLPPDLNLDLPEIEKAHEMQSPTELQTDIVNDTILEVKEDSSSIHDVSE